MCLFVLVYIKFRIGVLGRTILLLSAGEVTFLFEVTLLQRWHLYASQSASDGKKEMISKYLGQSESNISYLFSWKIQQI